jgi:hypothetical protein
VTRQPHYNCLPIKHRPLSLSDNPQIVGRMDITELQEKIEHYRVLENEVVARQNAATTDAARFQCERMRRLIQVVVSGLLESAKRESSRGHTGRVEHQAVRSQARA